MRIGLLLYGNLATLTGGYLYDRMVVEGLRSLGHEVIVIPLPTGSYLRRLGHGLSLGLVRRLLTARFDLILQDELCHPSLFLVNRRLRALGGPPVVAIVHHLLSDEPRGRWLNHLLAGPERRYLASVDGFICNSRITRHRVEALVGGERPQVVAYPAGDRFGRSPSPEAVAERAWRPGPLQLLYVGALIHRKGLHQQIQALAGMERGTWQLTVVGDPASAPAYARQAWRMVDQLGLGEAIRFLGPCQEEELAEIISRHHLLCMPYAYEGFGIAILEAMGFGLPAVASQVGAARETIDHGHNGFLLAPDDRAGLVCLLQRLHHDRPCLTALSEAALKTFANRPRWQETNMAIEGFIREVAGRGGDQGQIEVAEPRVERGVKGVGHAS